MNKKNRWGIVLAGVLMVGASTSVQAKETLLVQVPAAFDERAPVEPRIREECALDTILGNHVFQKVAEKFPDTLQSKDMARLDKGRALKLTILSVQGYGGGGWSGSKAMTVRADLLLDGLVIQTAVRREHSRGGLLGGMRGTCSILEIVAESLGRQFAAWMVRVDGAAAPAPAAAVPAAAGVSVQALPEPAAQPTQPSEQMQVMDQTNEQPEP
ncbi:hypothetical protein PQR62_16550 [Herbaspirillum lusitanum]|uniref:DUF4410 domain-containing protein n=1 Tax=Herbaspirillum lusitanum TaxID=213312 RepID=A0ABW9ACE2_9BURK